jgi:hypothetical protein
MKRGIETGIVVVLIIGMIVLSGCTGPVSTNTTTGVTTAIQIVNETVPVTQTPTATTPVPAIANSTTVPANQSLMSANSTLVLTTAVPGVTLSKNSTTKDTYSGPPSTLPVEGVTGTLVILVGSGSADGFTVYIAREGTDVPPFDAAYDPYRDVIGDQNPGYLHVRILPDGSSGIINLMPGTYLAYLPDRNGGEPEQQSFTIYAKSLTYLTFVGHASGSSGGCGC